MKAKTHSFASYEETKPTYVNFLKLLFANFNLIGIYTI